MRNLIELLKWRPDEFDAVRREEYERIVALGDAATPADAERLQNVARVRGMSVAAVIADLENREALRKAGSDLAGLDAKLSDRRAEVAELESQAATLKSVAGADLLAAAEAAVVLGEKSPTSETLRSNFLRARRWRRMSNSAWVDPVSGGASALPVAVDLQTRRDIAPIRETTIRRMHAAASEAIKNPAVAAAV